MPELPRWLTPVSESPLFVSRTLHVDLGLKTQDDDKFDMEGVQSLVSSLLLQDTSSCLAAVTLSTPSERNPWRALRKELNAHFDRYWGYDQAKSRGVLGEIVPSYDPLTRQTVYFGLLIIPADKMDKHASPMRTLNELKALPWLWPAVNKRSDTRILNALLNMAFRHFLFKNSADTDEFGWAYHSTLLSITGIVKDVLIGHEIQLRINYFGTLVMSVRRSALSVKEAFSDEPIASVYMTAVRRGQYAKLDARKWFKDPYLVFPTLSKLNASAEEKALQLERVQQTEWVQHNTYYDLLLEYLQTRDIPFVPVVFAPDWSATPALSQITKDKPSPLGDDYQQFLQAPHTLHIQFSGVGTTLWRETYAGQLKTLFSQSGLSNTTYVSDTASASKTVSDITFSINEVYEQQGVASSFWYEKEGQKEVRDSLSALLADAPSSVETLDPYSQQKLALYYSNSSNWHVLQGINTNTLRDQAEKTKAVSINKLLFELYLKHKLINLPNRIPVSTTDAIAGEFIGLFLVNPKQLPPRLAVINGRMIDSEMEITSLNLITLHNHKDMPLKAVRRWLQTAPQNVQWLKHCLDAEVLRLHHESFVLIAPEHQQLLTVSADALYCPPLLGQYDAARNEHGYDLDRKKHGRSTKHAPPHQSVIPHLMGPLTRGVYIEDRTEYVRTFSSVYRLQNKLPSNARVRDLSIYCVNDEEVTRHVSPMNATVLHMYLATLVGDYLKANSVSRSTLIEKLCRLAAVN